MYKSSVYVDGSMFHVGMHDLYFNIPHRLVKLWIDPARSGIESHVVLGQGYLRLECRCLGRYRPTITHTLCGLPTPPHVAWQYLMRAT